MLLILIHCSLFSIKIFVCVCRYVYKCVYVCLGSFLLHDTKLHVVRSVDFVLDTS